jgi:type I restriction enzyme, S subunit
VNGWKTVRLEDCCEIISGATPSTSVDAYWNGDINWATPKDLSELQSTFISDTPRKITQAGLNACAASILPAGSVLLSSRAPIGHVAVNTVPMATNQGFKSLVPRQEHVHAKFLYWWLRANRNYLEAMGNGATFKEVSKAVVSRIEIPLPPLTEQRRIAAILDKANDLRAKRRAAIAHLNGLTLSVFAEMFGNPVSNTFAWPRTRLVLLCSYPEDIRCGPFGTQLGKAEVKSEGIALWGIKQVNASFEFDAHEFLEERTAKRLSQYTIESGDIVMTRKGTVGNCAVYPDRLPVGIMHSDLLRIRVDRKKCDPIFLSHQLHHSRDVERQLSTISGGAVMPGINVTKLKNLEVLNPPVSLQSEFARRIAAIEKLRTVHRRSLTEMENLFASLQHRAFRGEL